jgi:hypothetical protein
MKRLFTFVAVACGVVLSAAACGRPGATDATGGGGGTVITSAPVDAALVTPRFGWVLTADQVLLTDDGGGTFRASPVALPPNSARAAYFRDAQHGWVAATDGETVTVARTADGGRTWQSAVTKASEEIGRLEVGFGDALRGALLAQVRTGGALSRAEMFTTADGGATWTAGSAPVAGHLRVDPDGRIWLAGGVLGDELYTSNDQARTWSRPALQLVKTTTVDGMAPPERGILPVTLTDGAVSRVALFRSSDNGANWRETDSVPLAARLSGAAPSVVRDSGPLVLDPAIGRLYIRRTTGAAASGDARTAAGLPSGVIRLAFPDENNGWALSSSGSCANGKQNCSITSSVSSTSDGGTTWRRVLGWRRPIPG